MRSTYLCINRFCCLWHSVLCPWLEMKQQLLRRKINYDTKLTIKSIQLLTVYIVGTYSTHSVYPTSRIYRVWYITWLTKDDRPSDQALHPGKQIPLCRKHPRNNSLITYYTGLHFVIKEMKNKWKTIISLWILMYT